MFLSPGSRAAPGLIARARRAPALPGNYVTEPNKLPKVVAGSFDIRRNGTTHGAGGNDFWDAIAESGGARITSDATANVWRTIVSASGGEGVVSAIVGPLVPSGRTVSFRITLDGRQFVLSVRNTVYAVRGLLGAAWVNASASNGFLSSAGADNNYTSFGDQTGGVWRFHSNASIFVPATRAVQSLGQPLLYYRASMQVEVMTSHDVTDAGGFEPRAGVFFVPLGGQ